MNRNDKFKVLKCKHSSLIKPLETKIQEQEVLLTNIDKCLQEFENHYEDLKTNCKHINQMTKTRTDVTQEILEIVQELQEFKDDVAVYSCYRDWISDFIMKIKLKFGQDLWTKMNYAILEKIKKEKVDYRKEDMKCISQLEDFLMIYDLTIKEFELLIKFKRQSNIEFHRGDKTLNDARQLLNSFPKNMKDYVNPLRKILVAIE
ncbi:hypothetical protein C1645_838337 [Glomus cerebriforme]|uniref:Uncharacterized protein n=1 Tax=Glomus cerebriforme TaxID=658196 RepID=A0A397S9G9_9GLOM|nr:hypothetical protein C1645_838337 [Glomus cerebriforme]